MRGPAVAAAVFAAACAGPAPRPAPAEAAPAHAVPVELSFEPPLPVAGVVHAAHESGVTATVPVTPTGGVLRLPPGPASLRLEFGAEVRETVVQIAPGAGVQVWRWRRP